MKAKSKVRGAESKVQSPRSGNEHPVKNWLPRLLIWLHWRP
ncbi:MAG: hypothetical protein NT154_33830 [Verrucomicrobia bacterium]|nr:hypothetical protein [Verrucomicrobiota bacterium]